MLQVTFVIIFLKVKSAIPTIDGCKDVEGQMTLKVGSHGTDVVWVIIFMKLGKNYPFNTLNALLLG
jgi:hypothetical protein